VRSARDPDKGYYAQKIGNVPWNPSQVFIVPSSAWFENHSNSSESLLLTNIPPQKANSHLSGYRFFPSAFLVSLCSQKSQRARYPNSRTACFLCNKQQPQSYECSSIWRNCFQICMSTSGDANLMVSIALHLLFVALFSKYAVFANSV
jgi:hypothetical protein